MTVVAHTTPLSTRLREGTRAEHADAESEGFVERLLAGDLDVDAYADLAVQQHAIYTALEEAGDRMRDDARGRALVFDELTRVPAIERDLEHLYGPGWRETGRVLPATERYVDRLRAVCGDVACYAAHAYTRYLGDLSGGQVVKRMLERHYGLDGAGLEFYTFDAIEKPKPFKDTYRERLDALGLDPVEADAAVGEAQEAFRLNRSMFVELGVAHP
jgi:heme oxygenase (biliverdin-producing, ferredoxin)